MNLRMKLRYCIYSGSRSVEVEDGNLEKTLKLDVG